jgi:hypothetical protein
LKATRKLYALSLNPELDAQIKKEWDKIGLSKGIQEALLQFMDAAALTILDKECRRIARCLVGEGLSPEKIKSITHLLVQCDCHG